MREAAQKPTADPNRLLADTLKSWAEKFPTKLLSGLSAKLRKDFADGLAAAKVEAVARLQKPRT